MEEPGPGGGQEAALLADFLGGLARLAPHLDGLSGEPASSGCNGVGVWGGGVSAVTEGAGSCAGPGPTLTIGGRNPGSSQSCSDISEPCPKQDQGCSAQG